MLNYLTGKCVKFRKIFLDHSSAYAVSRNPLILLQFISARVCNAAIILLRIVYNSRRVQCNLCNWQGNAFLAFSDYDISYIRRNSICPGCGSMERHRMFWKYVCVDSSFTKPNLTVLEVGPRLKSLEESFKARKIKYFSIDLRSLSALIAADVIHLPFSNKRFDFIICFQVLEHVIDDVAAINELYRVLKDYGKCYIQVPTENKLEKSVELTSPDLHDAGHRRKYGADFKQRLSSCGFQTTEINLESFGVAESWANKLGLRKEVFFQASKI